MTFDFPGIAEAIKLLISVVTGGIGVLAFRNSKKATYVLQLENQNTAKAQEIAALSAKVARLEDLLVGSQEATHDQHEEDLANLARCEDRCAELRKANIALMERLVERRGERGERGERGDRGDRGERGSI